MGYHMEHRGGPFAFTDKDEAFQATRKMRGAGDLGGMHWSWVSYEEHLAATTIEEVLAAWRWLFRDGELTFECGKRGDEELLFDAIAPHVEAGSYIEMQGEDGAIWRWIFNGTTCVQKDAKLNWD